MQNSTKALLLFAPINRLAARIVCYWRSAVNTLLLVSLHRHDRLKTFVANINRHNKTATELPLLCAWIFKLDTMCFIINEYKNHLTYTT